VDIIPYGNNLPRLIDPTYLLQLVEFAMFALALLTNVGLVYAALYYLLRNHANRHQVSVGQTPLGFTRVIRRRLAESLTPDLVFSEDHFDEAQ
jgi:hypothetical protein